MGTVLGFTTMSNTFVNCRQLQEKEQENHRLQEKLSTALRELKAAQFAHKTALQHLEFHHSPRNSPLNSPFDSSISAQHGGGNNIVPYPHAEDAAVSRPSTGDGGRSGSGRESRFSPRPPPSPGFSRQPSSRASNSKPKKDAKAQAEEDEKVKQEADKASKQAARRAEKQKKIASGTLYSLCLRAPVERHSSGVQDYSCQGADERGHWREVLLRRVLTIPFSSYNYVGTR